MATWDFVGGTITFGGIDFTKTPEEIVAILGLDKTSTVKLIEMANAATDPANREKLIRKVINTAITLGAKAAGSSVNIATLLV